MDKGWLLLLQLFNYISYLSLSPNKDKERREKRKDKDMDNSIDGMEV